MVGAGPGPTRPLASAFAPAAMSALFDRPLKSQLRLALTLVLASVAVSAAVAFGVMIKTARLAAAQHAEVAVPLADMAEFRTQFLNARVLMRDMFLNATDSASAAGIGEKVATSVARGDSVLRKLEGSVTDSATKAGLASAWSATTAGRSICCAAICSSSRAS